MRSAHAPSRRGTCVVTFDVAGSLQSFRSKGLQVPEQSDPIFSRLRQGLLERVMKSFPDAEVVPIDKDELRLEIWKIVKARINGHSVLVTCSEMSALNPEPDGLHLSINRLFDKNGEMLGYGPRPGYEYLDKQFDDLVQRIAGRPVILCKEGAFKGNTCCFILDELEKRGVSVAVLIMGFCDTEAKAQIQQKFRGGFTAMHLFDHLIEWIADRDLIPFLPGCGRVVGEVSTHSFMPVQAAEGFSCAFPYVLPFGMTGKWVSVNGQHALELSVSFLDLAIELFEKIEQKNQREILVREILGDNPRVSLPACVAQNGPILTPYARITSFLKEVRKKLG